MNTVLESEIRFFDTSRAAVEARFASWHKDNPDAALAAARNSPAIDRRPGSWATADAPTSASHAWPIWTKHWPTRARRIPIANIDNNTQCRCCPSADASGGLFAHSNYAADRQHW